MIKPLYKSFIPYVILLLAIVVVVFVFDSYAERLSTEPELIYLLQAEPDSVETDFAWQLENEIALDEQIIEKDDSLFRVAMRYFRKEDYGQAQEVALYLSTLSPTSPAVWNLRGIIAVRMLGYREAEEYFMRALTINPDFNDARINLASLCMSMHRYRDAEYQYRQAQKEDPYNPGIYYNLGLLYTSMEKPDSSLAAFAVSAELASGKEKALALCQKGIVQLGLKDTLGARKTLNESILLDPVNEPARLQLALTFSEPRRQEEELMKIYSLNPASFEANYQLGLLYMNQGRSSKAEHHYRKALEKNPYHERILKELGNLLIEQNRLEEAELVLSGFAAGDTLPQSYFFQARIAAGKGMQEEAVHLYRLAIEKSLDAYPEAYLNMAILYKQMSDRENAIACYQKAIRARPDYSLAYYNLALLYSEMDSTDQAIESYRESIRCDPGVMKSWYNLGRLYDRQGETGSAIDAYLHALRIDPEYSRAMLALGNAYMKGNDLGKAVRCYSDLLEIYPRYSKAWFNLGLAYGRMEDAASAMEAYENLIEVDPGEVRGRINLAILYGRNDRIEMAVKVLQDAMDLDTDNPDIRYNLALQYKKLEAYDKAVYQFMQVIELDQEYRHAYDQLIQLFIEREDQLQYEIISFRYQKVFGIEEDMYDKGKKLQELGEYHLALEAYSLAREAGDDRVWLDYWTGKAEMDLGDLGEASRWFQRVLERDGTHKFALYRLGQIQEMLGKKSDAERYYAKLLELDQEFRIVHKSPLQSQL